MTNTIAVKKRISEKGLKLQYIAEMLGISRYSLSLKLENKNEFKTSEVTALCNVLEIKSLKEKEALFFAKEVD